MKFLADEMLGDLCRWLRMLGYDTTYAKDYEEKYGKSDPEISVKDSELIQECFEQYRILITRDHEMVAIMENKFKKMMEENPENYPFFEIPPNLKVIPPCLLLESADLLGQLIEIRKKFKIRLDYTTDFARCPKCNSNIRKIDEKSDYKDKIPESVYNYHSEFWICSNPECRQIYWRGTHFNDILEKLKEVKNNSN